MPFPKPKLTEEMKTYIMEESLKGTKAGEIHPNLIAKFDLDDDFISLSRVTQLRSKTLKSRKKSRKELAISKQMTTEELDQMEEDAVTVKDLKTILSNIIVKPKSKIESIYYAFENHANPDPWTLLDIMSINSISPSFQRRVILNYFGLETVKEIWPTAKHGSLKKKVIDDPTSNIERLVKKRIKSLEGKIALNELEDVWKELKGKTEDPMVNLKRQLEFTTLLTQLENVNKNDAMGMMKEYRSMMKEDKSGDGSLLTTMKGMQDLGILGNAQKPEESALVRILQDDRKESRELLKDQKAAEVESLRREMELRDSTSNERTQLQMALLQKDTMSAEDWESLLLRRRQWAKDEGFVHKGDIESSKSQGEQALKRIESVGNRIDKLPDKLSGVLEKVIDKTVSTFDKLSQVQERRRLLNERREHQMKMGIDRRQGTRHTLPITNPDAFLDELEGRIDGQQKWIDLQRKGQEIEPSDDIEIN